MFYQDIKDRLAALEEEVLPKVDNRIIWLDAGFTLSTPVFTSANTKPKTPIQRLRDDVSTLSDKLHESNRMFLLLLDHLKLEHYKLTEENGSKKVTEGFRTKKKVKPVKVQANVCYCD